MFLLTLSVPCHTLIFFKKNWWCEIGKFFFEQGLARIPETISIRSSLLEVFFKNKTLPKNFVKFREKHFAWTLFKQSCRLKACNFMKKDLGTYGFFFLQFYNGFQYVIILSVLNCMSRVPSCPTCLTCFTCLTCLTCSGAIRACVSASYVPSFFTCHMYRHLLRALRAFIFYVP